MIDESVKLYNSIKQYNIIFIQLTSSCGKSLNISNLLQKYLNDENTILICNDRNLYSTNETNEELDHIITKRKICKNSFF